MDDLKSRAARFAESWAGRGDEKSDTQQYWRDLLDKVLLIPDTSDRQTLWFERRTALDGFIDALMIQARVLVEQKSLGVDLDRPEPRQGTMVTPVEQAKRYSDSLPPSERPTVLITCDFGTFRLYDLEADPLARRNRSSRLPTCRTISARSAACSRTRTPASYNRSGCRSRPADGSPDCMTLWRNASNIRTIRRSMTRWRC